MKDRLASIIGLFVAPAIWAGHFFAVYGASSIGGPNAGAVILGVTLIAALLTVVIFRRQSRIEEGSLRVVALCLQGISLLAILWAASAAIFIPS